MDATFDLSGVAHNFSYIFPFEKKWEESTFWKYMIERWTDCFLYSLIYIVLIFGVQFIMKKRPRFNLRSALAMWSGTLAVFSIAGAVRTIPELVSSLRNHGMHYSFCVPTYFNGVTSFWAFMFTVSKVYELGDTFFIVLRKQQLIFLHWYHHITVLCYVWYSYTDHTAPGRWFMVMNYTVHSVMYSYYFLRALKIHVPKQINMVITTLQLLQMMMGCFINIVNYYVKYRGEFCQQTYTNLRYSTMMYLSYFVLFAQFFYTNYVNPPPVYIPVKKTH